mgnify:CR=1 FL=1
MKRNNTLLFFLLATVSILAQTPERMSYQAVLRDASNILLTNQQVGIQISILQTTITGSAVYTETQTATTNINGLVSLEIGSGTSSDDFSAIDWSAGPYFIKTATDASGGSNYSIIVTSQLLSVPFALYAKTAGNDELKENTANKSTNVVTDAASDVKFPSVKSVNTYVDAVLEKFAYEYELDEFFGNYRRVLSHIDDTNDEINDNETALRGYIHALEARIVSLEQSQPIGATVGDLRDGGIVFWIDGNGGGKVCALEDAPTLNWSDAISLFYSYTNSDTGTGVYSDWYLPSKDELQLMYANLQRFECSTNTPSVKDDGLCATRKANFSTNNYWSSTEFDGNRAWIQYFSDGFQGINGKGNSGLVRAVRAF